MTTRERKAWMTTQQPWVTAEQRRALTTCAACGTHFEPREEIEEFVDNAGFVVSRYHLDCRPRR